MLLILKYLFNTSQIVSITQLIFQSSKANNSCLLLVPASSYNESAGNLEKTLPWYGF